MTQTALRFARARHARQRREIDNEPFIIHPIEVGRLLCDDGHVAFLDFGMVRRLPPAERQHWLEHIVTPAVSGTFLVMRLGAGHCMDDGDVRDWPD